MCVVLNSSSLLKATPGTISDSMSRHNRAFFGFGLKESECYCIWPAKSL
jgi:hypothetical protein